MRHAFLLPVLLALPAVAPAQVTAPSDPEMAVPAAAMRDGQTFLYAAGQSDVFEVTSSQVALKRSRNPQVRAFAQQMIADHTQTTNNALASSKAAGVMAPPPVLDARQRAMIAELEGVPAGQFDATYVRQQLQSHRMTLDTVTGYARGGDNPTLKRTAQATVPIVTQHLRHAEMLGARMR